MKSVLVVDDVADIRYLCRIILESVGYEVAEAETADQALVSLAASSPDFIVLDISMPGMSGWELLEQLRTAGESAPPRVIICSAHAGSTEAKRAVDDGAYAFLAKPFTPQELLALVDEPIAC